MSHEARRDDGQPLTAYQQAQVTRLLEIGYRPGKPRLYAPPDTVWMTRRARGMWDCYVISPESYTALGRLEKVPE